MKFNLNISSRELSPLEAYSTEVQRCETQSRGDLSQKQPEFKSNMLPLHQTLIQFSVTQ
jgi:hypothetical protein